MLLDRVMEIDGYIEEELKGIIEGIDQMHKHAMHISEALKTTNTQIFLNTQVTDDNLKKVDEANSTLEKVMKYAKRSYCWLDVILILLLLMLVYLGYREIAK